LTFTGQKFKFLNVCQNLVGQHSIRRINFFKQLIGAKSYLEIGVNKGATFNHLDFETKVAVDPKFNFETAQFASDGVEFHEISSDKYFEESLISTKFDVIFLDGLHTWDQTYRDFVNCLLHCGDQAIILIDDTFPSDSYSAMRNIYFAGQARRRESPPMPNGEHSEAWHGDTYKLLFLLRLFHTKYEYATILDKGNCQTVVWPCNYCNSAIAPSPQKPFRRFTNERFLHYVIEHFHEVDYYWTMNACKDIFQIALEDDLFEYLANLCHPSQTMPSLSTS